MEQIKVNNLMQSSIFYPAAHSIKNIMGLVRHEIWMASGRYAFLLPFFSAYSRFSLGFESVSRDSDLVIEGYPRSANTFARVAFQMAQASPVKIAHHIHGPGQILQGCQWRIPCLVILRDPVDAIVSLLLRYPYLRPSLAFRNYYLFYKRILPIRSSIIVASFDEVVNDFGEVIKRINRKYSTDFAVFQHSQENVEACYAQLETLDRRSSGQDRVNDMSVARPSAMRDKVKAMKINSVRSVADFQWGQMARKIYGKLMKDTAPIAHLDRRHSDHAEFENFDS